MNKRIAAIFTLLLVFCVSFTVPFANAPARASSITTELWKQDMLDRVNLLRSKGCYCGRKYMPPVPPLRWNEKLEKAAAAHAADMNKHHFLGHKSSNGKNSGDRASKAGYSWRLVGENVAWGQLTVEEVQMDWEKSPGHCRNLMYGAYKELGAARQADYWAQVFGAPAP